MSWEIQSKEWLADYVRAIIANELPELPPKEQRFGASTVRWWEGKPGDAVIMAEGGSCDDRSYAEFLCGIQLAQHGYKRAQFTFNSEELTKTSGWTDIMAKAKRLIQSGQVTILRNGYNNIVAHVIGDHGEYNSEIGRDDPNSQAISTWQCFLPDTPITMADGTRKPISQVEPGDEVITHLGNVKRVTAAWAKPYSDDVTRVKLAGMDEEVVATSNHPFYVANEDFHLERLVGWRGRRKTGAQPGTAVALDPVTEWRDIGLVEAGDYMSMTPTREESPLCLEGIEIDEEIAYLLGWYAAEGFTIKSTPNRIGFNLHWEEWNVAEKLSEICKRRFGTAGTVRKMTWPQGDRHWMTDFRVSSPALRRLVERLVGVGAASKRLAPEMMILPTSVQRSFVQAWFEGDGCLDSHGLRSSILTTSADLAVQLRLLLARLGHASSFSWDDDNDGAGFVKNWRRIYRVRWVEAPTRPSKPRFFKEDKMWLRVEEVTYEHYNGLVYDLEVEDDHSFQAFSINCHNCECPWDQYAWARTRQWKKYEGRPCAHVLAAYWKAKSTPLDDYDPEAHGPMPGQKLHPSDERAQSPGALPGEPPEPEGVDVPHPPGALQGPKTPGPPAPMGAEPDATGGPLQAPLAPPTAPGVLPPSPMEQLQMQQPPAPGMTPGGLPSPPGSVSVPGAKMPSPFNPVQMPGGTYSAIDSADQGKVSGGWVGSGMVRNGEAGTPHHSAQQFYPQQAVYLKQNVWGQLEGKSEEHGAGSYTEVQARRADGSPQKAEVLGQDPTTGWIEIIVSNDDGKQLEPFLTRCFVEASDISPSRSNDTGFIRRH